MGIDPITASIGLSAGGAVLGALGGDNPEMMSAPTSGFATLDPEIKDYLMDSIFPRITAWGETPYQTVPLRRANAEDYDPIFGSPSRQFLQQYYDARALPSMVNQGQGQADPNAEAQAQAVNDLRNEMLAREYIKNLTATNSGAMRAGYGGVSPSMYSNENLAEMGNLLQESGYRGGAIPFHGFKNQGEIAAIFNAPRRSAR